MKNVLLLLFIVLSVSFAYSQTHYMHVKLKDGTKMTYEVADITKIDFSQITSVEDVTRVSQIVKSFKLLQNYPNPFNPLTTIQYELPKSGPVEVNVFNMNGRLIKTIVNQNQQAGSHKVVWDGQNESGHKVASGFYVYTVKFENTISAKKMILLK